MSKRNKRSKMLRAATRAPAGIRDVAASTWSRVKQRKHDDRKLGTFGAASTIRVIVKDGISTDQDASKQKSVERFNAS
jgi:hypothetical protein